MSPAGPILTDLGSDHGTVVRGAPIPAHQPHLLVHGTVFQIGPYVFTYYAPAAAGPRPALPLPAPIARTSAYLRHLPIIFQDNDFLGRYLLLFESIWEPLERRQDHVESYFDPATCPASFLPWLAGWLDPSLDTQWPEARLRALLGEAVELYRWRGTRYGLARTIELCTGLTPIILDDPATPFVFHVRLVVPEGTDVDRRRLEGLIQAQKPAHAGYVLDVVAV
jgi:phage tail-like protein